MDRFNVITPTSNLNELELDMNSWSNLPYDIRMRSDEDCLRMFGMTNAEFYNRLKSSIVANQITSNDNSENIINIIKTEGALLDTEFTFSDDETSFDKRKMIADQLELSPEVVIISPIKDNSDMSEDELNIKYNKYNMLSDKNKRFSNSYSISLWGYDVPNMFTIVKNRILNFKLDQDSEDDNLKISVESSSISKIDRFMDPILESVNKKLLEDDKVGLYVNKLDSLANMDTYTNTVYQSILPDIDHGILGGDYCDTLPNVTPYFTPDEMEILAPVNGVGNISRDNYYRTISEKMKKYNESTGEEKEKIANELVSIGWNPSVDINKENLNYARNRQINWLKEHSVKIVDISKFNISESVLESTNSMKKLYEEKELYPIFIVISHSQSLFGKIINKVKNTTYSHAGISMDSDLNQICTFKWGSIY